MRKKIKREINKLILAKSICFIRKFFNKQTLAESFLKSIQIIIFLMNQNFDSYF